MRESWLIKSGVGIPNFMWTKKSIQTNDPKKELQSKWGQSSNPVGLWEVHPATLTLSSSHVGRGRYSPTL